MKSPSSEVSKFPNSEVSKFPSSEVSIVATCSDKVSCSSNCSFESSLKKFDQVNEVKQARCQGGGEVVIEEMSSNQVGKKAVLSPSHCDKNIDQSPKCKPKLRKSQSSDCSNKNEVSVTTSKVPSITEFPRHHGKSNSCPSPSVLIQLFEQVYQSALPNYRGCRITLPFSNFNIPLWRELLSDYNDNIVCDFLEFGFPLDFDKSVQLSINERRNHKGARDYPEFVDQYLHSEVEKLRIAGPFKTNPLSIPIIVSPLNSVPKRCSDERRVIVDLSWPLGKGSVNSGISKEFYLQEKIESHYASVEEVCQMVLRIGPGAMIYKRDLRQAYRQFPVDPADYYLLGYFWKESYYFDTVLAMGQRNAGVGCSRVTNAVMFIHAKHGHHGTSYLDDLIGVSEPCFATAAYDDLGNLLHQLGLVENIPKACPPAVKQTVLGVLVNTETMTISVTDERMSEINILLGKWREKKTCNKKELRSIVGKLAYISKCVRQSRIFLNRLLEVLRSVDWKEKTRIRLSAEFHKEIRWWSLFMDSFNGVAFIPSTIWLEPDVSFATDSCLDGCGGICEHEFFHTKFPKFILDQDLPIHKLEFLAVLLGARIWGPNFRGLKLRIFCDNQAVVDVINSSKTKDPFMATCLRELWLVVSTNEFELRAVHLPGEENRVADWLSRWHLGYKYQRAFNSFISDSSYDEVFIHDELLTFSGVL